MNRLLDKIAPSIVNILNTISIILLMAMLLGIVTWFMWVFGYGRFHI